MFYSNPFNQNCAVFLSENKVFNASNAPILLSNETVQPGCASFYSNSNIEIYQQTTEHPNPYNNPNIAQTCQGDDYPDNPGSGIRDCGVRYFVKFDGNSLKGTGSPYYIPTEDFEGDVLDGGMFNEYYSSLTDARMVRDKAQAHWNIFRGEDGCTDSSALNYSAVATNPCPCSVSTPIWTQGQDQSNNPQLQTTAEQPGDCNCLMPPTTLDGQGYLVEEWEYVGDTDENDPNPPYAKLTKQWKWKRNASKSVLPQPSEEDNLLAIAKKGWRAIGLNAPQEFIVKPTLIPGTWVKYRLITATGFEKMGCMDNTAKNYDPLAQIGFTKPDFSNTEECGRDYDDPLAIACKEQLELWKEYGCKYCIDDDMYATQYNQVTGECECQSGYSLKGGKCKKDGGGNGNGLNIDDSTPISFATVIGGIIGITALGLLATTAKAKKGSVE
tara:strand:- start:5311 stop:6633 length:1323 start_codon:yes stop_codon:yes gene_type:complete